MSGETAGQLACEAFWVVIRGRDGLRNDPADAWPWATSQGADEAWEAAAAAVETEQLRLARADRDQLRKAVLSLAAAWGDLAVKCDEAAALDGMAKAAVRDQATFARQLRECADQLRKAAEPPS